MDRTHAIRGLITTGSNGSPIPIQFKAASLFRNSQGQRDEHFHFFHLGKAANLNFCALCTALYSFQT